MVGCPPRGAETEELERLDQDLVHHALRSQTPDIFLEKNNVEIDRPRLQVAYEAGSLTDEFCGFITLILPVIPVIPGIFTSNSD